MGALTVIGQTPPSWWEVRSGDAGWDLHAGNLDVSVGANPDSLMVLSAMASEEVQGTGAEGSGEIVGGPGEFGPEIDNTGEQEDTSYLMGLVMQDGTDQKSMVTTDRPLASVANTVGQFKPTHTTHYPALMDANPARLNLGVGEEVDFGNMPDDTQWTCSGGGLTCATCSSPTFTAPSNAPPGGVSTTVIATWNGIAMPTVFTVFPPTGYDHATITSTHTNDWPYPPAKVAAQMYFDVWMAPTSVFFYRVQFSEVGSHGVPTGYFADTNFFPNPWHHYPDGKTGDYNWQQLPASNYFSDWAAFIPDNLPLSWDTGTLSFDIPVDWRIGGNGDTNSMNGWNLFISFGASGTVIVTKFGQTVLRTEFNKISPAR